MRPAASFALTVASLAVFNVARALGLLGPPLVSAAVLCAAMLLIAWCAQMTASDLGLRRDRVAAGLVWGFGALLIILVVLLAAAALPAARSFFEDSRADISGARLLYELLVATLLFTVIPEELAFRGVLLASGLRLFSTWRAVLITSALFGLWHIAPTLHTMTGNTTVRHAPGVFVVAASVALTFCAGVIFCWLRLRSDSLVAPAVAHLATNGLGLAVAWFVLH